MGMKFETQTELDACDSVRDTLDRSETLLAETGHYSGISDLELRRRDPLCYEGLHAQLLSAVIQARETARRITGSPAVREEGEFVVALYTPEGDAVVLSTGIMVHVNTISRFIKWMIRNDYEADPGFAEGDIFGNNDPFIGDVHPADMMDVMPLLWQGELLGWVGAVSHVPDVGGIEPGGEPSIVTDRFGEGLFICAEKVGENDQLTKTHVIRCERNLRNPTLWILDEKAKISACQEVREKLYELVDTFGADYYKRATREFIEEQRRGHLARVKTTLVPGTYRGITHYTHLMAGKEGIPTGVAQDLLYAIPIEIEVHPSGEMRIDFEGTPEAGPHPANCSPAGMDGGLFITLTQVLAYDGKVNHGAWATMDLRLPSGTLVNPADEKAATSTSWGVLIPAFAAYARLLSRGFFARGFVEEVFAGGAATPFQEWGGIDQRGERFGGGNFECGACGSGARALLDGIDTGYAGWNPEGDMGSVETWEREFPVLYMGRRNMPDSGGAGRFRGGVAFAPVLKVHGSEHAIVGLKEACGRIFDQSGLFGGYPAPNAHRHHIVRDSNLSAQANAHEPLPHVISSDGSAIDMFELVDGDQQEVVGQAANVHLRSDDLFGHSYSSGGGYGDPLERDPERVAKDAEEGAISAARAASTYGVVVSEAGGVVAADPEATEARRGIIRARRAATAMPVATWRAKERTRVEAGELIEPVREMYRSAFRVSTPFAETFRNYWGLGNQWEMR